MSLSASRGVLRRSRFAWPRQNNAARQQQRNVSTEGAVSAAENAKNKAMEGLSRVTSSASAAASRVGSAMGNMSAGGQTGRMSGAIGTLVPMVTYYSRVGLELGKLIVNGRGMNPPTMQTIQSYFQPAINMVRNPQQAQQALSSVASSPMLQPRNMLATVRSADSATMTTYAVVAAEVIGFFSLGEIIGRMKLVGYRSSQNHHGAH